MPKGKKPSRAARVLGAKATKAVARRR